MSPFIDEVSDDITDWDELPPPRRKSLTLLYALEFRISSVKDGRRTERIEKEDTVDLKEVLSSEGVVDDPGVNKV